MKRILVATDGSRAAAAAVRFGIELAKEQEAELVVAHVVPTFDLVPATVLQIGGVFPHDPGPSDIAVLEDAAAEAFDEGVVATTALLRGETVEELVRYADGHGVDLIVVGSRGHGALAGTLLGSVSLALLARADRPVAIVREADGERPGRERESVVARR